MARESMVSIRIDPTLKEQADEVFSELGMTLSGAFTMFLKQVVREQAIPLSLTIDSENAVYATLLEAELDEANGKTGRNADDVIADMRRIIDEAGTDE